MYVYFTALVKVTVVNYISTPASSYFISKMLKTWCAHHIPKHNKNKGRELIRGLLKIKKRWEAYIKNCSRLLSGCLKESSALWNTHPRRVNWEGDYGAENIPSCSHMSSCLDALPSPSPGGCIVSLAPVFWANVLTPSRALRRQKRKHQTPAFPIYPVDGSNFRWKNYFHKAFLESERLHRWGKHSWYSDDGKVFVIKHGCTNAQFTCCPSHSALALWVSDSCWNQTRQSWSRLPAWVPGAQGQCVGDKSSLPKGTEQFPIIAQLPLLA